MSASSSDIYTGIWINWTDGFIAGSTLTLSNGNAAILTAFIATFIGFVGNELWKIPCFLIYLYRATQKDRDGLHYQLQVALRNSSTPADTVLVFLRQAYRWRRQLKKMPKPAFLHLIFALTFLVSIAALSIVGSAAIVQAAGNERLVRSGRCGYWLPNNNSTTVLQEKMRRDSDTAAAYARSCYGKARDSSQCTVFKVPSIKWKPPRKSLCPFEESICFPDKHPGYQMDTGRINSHDILGINTPPEESIDYRRITTCSNLNARGFARELDIDSAWYNRLEYAYGASGYGADGISDDTTFIYYTRTSSVENPYSVRALYNGNSWVPNKELARTDANVSLVMISPNSVAFQARCNDSAFTATTPYEPGSIYWKADFDNSFIACADQYQFCNPATDTCSPLTFGPAAAAYAKNGELSLTPTQEAIVDRLEWSQFLSGTAQVIQGRSVFALRASETLFETIQAPLPDNQWEIEVTYWFETGLARLQLETLNYARQTDDLTKGLTFERPRTKEAAAMCNNQKTAFANGTTSFNLLGLILTIVLGMLILIISSTMQKIAEWLSNHFLEKKLGHKTLQWRLDEQFQLQRLVFQARDVPIEGDLLAAVPLVGGGAEFANLARGNADRNQDVIRYDPVPANADGLDRANNGP